MSFQMGLALGLSALFCEYNEGTSISASSEHQALENFLLNNWPLVLRHLLLVC
jgi:hypothetical protein